MIDVVFLLLVFFMLAARFGREAALPLMLAAPGAGGNWQGPPRLVEIAPEAVRLNGVTVDPEVLAGALVPLMTAPDQPVILRAVGGADLQRLLDLVGKLQAAGLSGLVLVP
jgi:biopolymer transport protein ExbD